MANIKNELNNIKSAVFGKDVRKSIHDGIDAINKEAESTANRQTNLENTFDQLVINAGNSNAEIVDARVKSDGTSYSKLGDRLNEVDSQLEHNVKYTSSYLNAIELGCDNTGVNDCTEIIQSAIDNGNSIYFPNGIYKVGLIHMKTSTKILGETKTGVVLKCLDSSVESVIYSNKSNHNYSIENITINANYETNGILLENSGEYEAQDLEIRINNVKITKAKTGLLAEIGRGSEFTSINCGDCALDGIAIKTTDTTVNNCITAMCGRHGVLASQANNSINNTKSFLSGMTAGYGAGFKVQGSFNRLVGCEAQQNKYENLHLQNANGCVITGTILDGAGYKSDEAMMYNDNGEGDLIPISSLRLYNSKNNIIDVAIINGRLESEAKTAFYCQYEASDFKNSIKYSTYNISSRDFSDFIIDDHNNYFKNNDVKINGVVMCNKVWITPPIENNEVEIAYGGYIVKDNVCYVTISVKGLNDYSWETRILNEFPKPINRVQLAVSEPDTTAHIRTDKQLFLSKLVSDKTYIITGSYLIK